MAFAGSVIAGDRLLAFALASVVLIVIPGPRVLFVVGRALAHGRRTALATVSGHAAGNYGVAACVAFRLGTLVERSATVFLVVKAAGAAYLVWLGIQAFRQRGTLAARSARRRLPEDPVARCARASSWASPTRRR